MDAVAARDHLQEAVSCCAICMARLSQMAEELVLWSSAEFRLVRMGEGFATELADHLAEQGVPFREAHEAVARLVRWCEEQGSNLAAADSGAARQFHPLLPDDLSPWLDPRAAVERRKTHGGTAWTEVERQVALLREIV